FFVCIAVGVAAIVALRSVIQSIRGVFGTETKAVLAADVVASTTRDVVPGAATGLVAKMGEIRAVQAAFPLYGTVVLQGGQTYSHALLQNHGAIVRPELLTTLGVKVGDQI